MSRLDLLRRAAQTFDLEVGSDPSGGYLVPTGRSRRRRKKPKIKDSGNERTGVMVGVSIDPVLARQLAIEDGEDPDHLHLTLAYCGDAADLDVQDVASAVASLSVMARSTGPLSGIVGGIGRFMASETSDGRDVFYASVDVPGLVELRVKITEILTRAGVPAFANHGFSPHITLAYLDPSDPSPFERIQARPFPITEITFRVGEEEIILPLSGTSVKYSEDQPRDDHGRWGSGGGSGSGQPGTKLPKGTPPSLSYKHPPPPLGKSKVGGKAGGMAADGRTNTVVGDQGEKLIQKQLGFINERGTTRGGSEKRQGAMDVRYDHSNYVFEVKTRTTFSQEYKMGPKKDEVDRKREYCRKNGLKPGSLMLIADTTKNQVHAYWRPGIGSFRLNSGASGTAGKSGWHFAGTVKIPKSMKSVMVGDTLIKYSDDQPRDDHGRFGSGGTDTATATSSSHEPVDEITADKLCREWDLDLSDEEHDAIAGWTASDYEVMRRVDALPGSRDSNSPGATRALELVKQAIEKAPIPAGKIYRGFNGKTEEQAKAISTPGTIVRVRALSSFTQDRNAATEFATRGELDHAVLWQVQSNQSGRAIWDASSSRSEREVVVQKGTAYQVISTVDHYSRVLDRNIKIVKVKEVRG